jgi:TPR repeat protein
MAVTSFFYKSHTGNLPKKSDATAELPGASEQIKLENAGERDIAPDSVKPDPVVSDRVVSDRVKKVQHVAAEKLGTPLTAASEQVKFKNAGQQDTVHDPVTGVQRVGGGTPRTAYATNAAKENDPVELWKAVKRGSVSAEVALANLYLEGEAVPQNCEQAHMLLHAASMKGSKAADDSLKSSYAGRCE